MKTLNQSPLSPRKKLFSDETTPSILDAENICLRWKFGLIVSIQIFPKFRFPEKKKKNSCASKKPKFEFQIIPQTSAGFLRKSVFFFFILKT